MKGQQSLEMIIIYSLAIIVIGSIFYIIFTFFPSLTGVTTQPSYSGFSGFRVVQQGYIPSKSIFYIEFQNLLNENGEYNMIKSDEEAKGKDIYFLALYRNSLKQAPKAAFIVQVEKQPKEGYLPYQENHLMKDGYYKFHLGDSVSKILGY